MTATQQPPSNIDLNPAPRPRRPSTTSRSSSSLLGPPVGHDDVDADGAPTRFRRTSTSSASVLHLTREEIMEREALINEYEAEEERLVNVLGRRMEEMREERSSLHTEMEEESEAAVNRLQRQLSAAQTQLAAQGSPPPPMPISPSASMSSFTALPLSPNLPASPGLPPSIASSLLQQQQDSDINSSNSNHAQPNRTRRASSTILTDPLAPTESRVLEALRTENKDLRDRLSDAERGFIHVCRTADAYREELVSLRQRLNLPTDDLFPPSPTSRSPVPPASPGLATTTRRFSLGRRIPSGSALDTEWSGALNSTSPEVERRLSFGAPNGPGSANGRVAERGVLRRAGSVNSASAAAAAATVLREDREAEAVVVAPAGQM